MYPIGYNQDSIKVEQTEDFDRWFEKLGDIKAKARIDIRVRRMSLGNFGDTRYVGGEVSELRIDYGPGYRVYFIHQGQDSIVIVLGGTKGTQQRDIEQAQALAKQILQEE